MQPVMGPVFNTKHMGDILISTGKKVKGEDAFPFKDFYEALQGYWTRISAEAGSESFDTFWQNIDHAGRLLAGTAAGSPGAFPARAGVQFSRAGAKAGGGSASGHLSDDTVL